MVKDKQLNDHSVTERRLGNIKGEMDEMKRKHVEQLRNSETAREKAELRVLEIQSQQEKRVVNLESRLGLIG